MTVNERPPVAIPDYDAVDSRTLLPGRDSFYRDISNMLNGGVAKGQPLSLLDIEISGLEFVLRTFGPDERDTVVRELGERVKEAMAGDQPLYHITQDRFALLLHGESYQKIVNQAEAIIAALDSAFTVAGISYNLYPHIGISQYPNHADSIGELVRTAVFACHQARLTGSKYQSFDKELDEWERYRFRLLTDLEAALQTQDGLQMAYQPVVNINNDQCEAVECLCRWSHSELGPIAPGHFLPYVERTPLIMPLTETTAGISFKALGDLHRQGYDGDLAINLSSSLFHQADLVDRLLEQIRFYNIDPKNIHFEITETGIMQHPKLAASLLGELRDKGCKIAVDDFGTGHSSLAYLADLPVDAIKIDRHFIDNLDTPWGQAIVSATAVLADKLNLTTVAEGIENAGQYDHCRKLGITYAQGYFLGRPMFQDDLTEWFSGREQSQAD